jgi:serine/threonine protein kinase
MFEQQTMEELFDEASPDISDQESSAMKALIRRILQYDPAKRPSAEDILLDPWFARDDWGGSVSHVSV